MALSEVGDELGVAWELELGEAGEVPRRAGIDDGVLRIGVADNIIFRSPAGSRLAAQDSSLLARSELGETVVIEGGCRGAVGDWEGDWRPPRPGPYEFFALEDGASAEGRSPTFRIIVDPTLRIRGAALPARAVVQLTTLSRCAGPIERWPETLGPHGALGYNMVHFTPIQPPGDSGSCYSLDDQNDIDPTLLAEPGANTEERLAKVRAAVTKLEEDSGMLSAMDIVLNHTAGTAPWLLEHPECAYNVTNSPHLQAAAELDEKLAWFSDELRQGRHGGPHINNDGDVNRVIGGIKDLVLQELRLWEYFELDQGACNSAFGSSSQSFEREDYEAFKAGVLPSLGAKRKGAFVSGDVSKRYCRNDGQLRDWCRRVQDDLWGEWGQMEQDILGSLRGGITYERLEARKGPVGEGGNALTPRYFRRLKLSADAQKRTGKDSEMVAHNGWVMGWPATEDFAAPSWRSVYLRRHLCAWGDCVKLRFGDRPEDAPFLWDHMTRYAVSMARIFHAIRLDNAHSTPLHVSRHVLAQVRKANPHCWVFAELFTGDFQTDLLYQGALGINALIREAMQCGSVDEIAGHLRGTLWGAHPVGEVSHTPTLCRQPVAPRPRQQKQQTMTRSASCALIGATSMPLRPRPCPALLFDCTHDNQTPNEKRHPRDALPNAALVAASCASIGSVRGYDELLPFNPSVVSERRLYSQLPSPQQSTFAWPPLTADAVKPAAAAPEESRTFELVWPHGASSSVAAHGGWDGWKSGVPFIKQGDGRWVGSITVPAHITLPVQYKFVVDGNWTCDGSQPTASDEHGNVNNIVGGRPQVVAAAPGSNVEAVDPLPSASRGLAGIAAVKQVLNALHERLARDAFLEVDVQQLAGDIVSVQRRSADTGRRTFFVTRSVYGRNICEDLPWDVGTLELTGTIAAVHLAATLYVPDQNYNCGDKNLTGLNSHLKVYGSLGDVAYLWRQNNRTMLKLKHFPPGSVLVFSLNPNGMAQSIADLDGLLTPDAIESPLRDLTLSELNYLLFSCESEESDRSAGKRAAYDIPGFGPLVYCGLMGVCAALDAERVSRAELAGSPVVENIRAGDWLLDYLIDRLEPMPGLAGVRSWLDRVRAVLSRLPRDLVPFHFDVAISELCSQAASALTRQLGVASSTSSLVRDLAIATAQFWGATPSAPLHWDNAKRDGWQKWPSLCAGLPHFASGFMRNWGRDTFISLRGCLLATQRFDEARSTILVYASVVRHGLCPNLLDAANNPRYNARDATWFLLQAIQDYVEMAPEGTDFLAAPVSLKWPVKDWDAGLAHLEPKTVADLIHLICSAHAKGIQFREWNAGNKIDEHMTDNGFNISVRLDEDTGLIYGGNEANCGTWMDKMGSSDKAGNRGVPATPRDGAAVEIIGLLKSTLRWVSGLDAKVFPHTTMKTSSGKDLTYGEWNKRLGENFERLFWIGDDDKAPTNLRGFYRDTVGATRSWQDFQLRPNFPIAMAVAPELFTRAYAQRALRMVADRLVGPLGMCTLDPSDKEYRGDYHNDDDSEDKAVAHGWNYHQGPEWVWPLGFYLKACNVFFPQLPAGVSPKKSVASGSPASERGDDPRFYRQTLMGALLAHRRELALGKWRALPELTNSKGTVCHHSCPSQAWSIATLLDAMRDFDLTDEA